MLTFSYNTRSPSLVYTVPKKPKIRALNGDTEVRPGDSTWLTCNSVAGIAYKFYKDGVALGDFGDEALWRTNLSEADQGVYSCKARNGAGESAELSDPITLTLSKWFHSIHSLIN